MNKSSREIGRDMTCAIANGFLDRLLTRRNSILWKAVVEWRGSGRPMEPSEEAPVEAWDKLFLWQFEYCSSSPALRQCLGDVGEGGRHLPWIFDLAPEDRLNVTKRSARALLSGASGYDQHFCLGGADGVFRSMYETVEVESCGEGRWELAGLLTDISNQKEVENSLLQSEAHFRSIWEGSVDGMRLTDEAGKILAVNDAFCTMVGRSREDLVGHPLSEAYGSMDLSPADMLELNRRRCLDLKPGNRYLAKVRLLSGVDREFEISLSEVAGGGGSRSILTIFRDVTEARQAEEKRLQLERKILDAQRLESLGILAGGVAHDFNNLLTAILENANLAMFHLDPSSPVRPSLESIEKTSLHAADLCKQMLIYSGRGQTEFRCVSMNNLVEEMAHLLEVSVKKTIVMRYRLKASLPCVRAEPVEIQQILLNLVINASEAIGKKNGVVTVSTGLVRADRAYLEKVFLAPELPDGDYLTLEVSDTGCGMTAEMQACIFDPFFTTKLTGRGLGLAAVLGILQRHKGALKIYSEPDQGTTFKILLPTVEEQLEREATHSVRPTKWMTQGKVLVVDDEQTVRAVTARMLERCGLTVLLAKDGKEAVELFRRHHRKLDLVLLDMTMPVMGGEEVYREIRRIGPDVKVLLMSGYMESEATAGFAGDELIGFLHKPFNWAELEERLKKVLPESLIDAGEE